MKGLLTTYRVLATVVGISIITLIFIGVPLKYAYRVFPDLWPSQFEDGEPLQRLGGDINAVLGTAHGFIYMAFVLLALVLASRARWPIGFTVVTLLCGTIPVLSFWAEHRAVVRVRREHLEAPVAPPAGAETTV